MTKTRGLHGRVERLEEDGETHTRDCECARCEAGFTPTEHDRLIAAKRVAGKQGRRAAVRAAERKKEAARLKQLDLTAYFQKGNAVVDAEVQRLRTLRARAVGDRRMDEFLRLRQLGMSVERALSEVDRSLPGVESGAENDNAEGHAGPRQAQGRTAAGNDSRRDHRIGLLFP